MGHIHALIGLLCLLQHERDRFAHNTIKGFEPSQQGNLALFRCLFDVLGIFEFIDNGLDTTQVTRDNLGGIVDGLVSLL